MAEPEKVGYVCDCLVFNEAGMWGAAHWNETLTHKCQCGRTNTIRRGHVLKSNTNKKPKP